MAPAESRDATMSAISTERKFEHGNWPTAKARPQTRAGATSAGCRASVDDDDQDQRHEQRQERRLPSDHRAELLRREAR